MLYIGGRSVNAGTRLHQAPMDAGHALHRDRMPKHSHGGCSTTAQQWMNVGFSCYCSNIQTEHIGLALIIQSLAQFRCTKLQQYFC